MEALGTWLGTRGCSEASVWHRISKGDAFFALLCDPKVPVKRRDPCFLCLLRGLRPARCWRMGVYAVHGAGAAYLGAV